MSTYEKELSFTHRDLIRQLTKMVSNHQTKQDTNGASHFESRQERKSDNETMSRQCHCQDISDNVYD